MESEPGPYQRLKIWWARHFSRASAQFGLGELIFTPLLIWAAVAKPVDWSTRWKFPLEVKDPMPWGAALMFSAIGIFFLIHGIGNVRNWKPAVALSGAMGAGLIVLGVAWAWYYGSHARIRSASGLEQFDSFMNYLVGWGYVWVLVVCGWHLVQEAKDRIRTSPLRSGSDC